MEEKKIVLKPKKKNMISFEKITKLFSDKKKRYLFLFLITLPFLIAIGIFGYIAYRDVTSLLNLATNTTEIKDDSIIESKNYVLRPNATDLQKEYFLELKTAIEVDNADEEVIAGLICKNYVADFYTWTNKQGQYDVGGLCYVFDGKSETTDYKNSIYTKARDEFYKYLTNYISEYGVEELLEVSEVNVVKSKKTDYKYVINEIIGVDKTEDGSYYNVYGDKEYDCYDVTCNWLYKDSEKYSTKNFVTKMNFLVIDKDGRFEIVEASEKTIDARKVEEETEEELSDTNSDVEDKNEQQGI